MRSSMEIYIYCVELRGVNCCNLRGAFTVKFILFIICPIILKFDTRVCFCICFCSCLCIFFMFRTCFRIINKTRVKIGHFGKNIKQKTLTYRNLFSKVCLGHNFE